MLIFSISILPKAWFHDVFADHKDVLSCKIEHKSSAVHTQGYDCHFDDLVVTSPFLYTEGLPDISIPVFFSEQQGLSLVLHISTFTYCQLNRGPPSI